VTKFDWEKDPYAQAASHHKKRQSRQDALKKKAAMLIKKERELQAPYQSGVNSGREQERARIVELIENGTESIAKTWVFSNAISAAEFKTDDGTDAVSVDDAWLALEAQLNWLLKEIKGEK
jgi:hypothetical protein